MLRLYQFSTCAALVSIGFAIMRPLASVKIAAVLVSA
jgi:hypothetical protein